MFNEVLPISYFSLLKNTYFWYEDFKEETFCLLYQFDGRIRGKFHKRTGFTVYEDRTLLQHKLFKGYRDYHNHVIYEFGLTEELLDFRNLLIEGKYSKLPKKIKKTIITFNEHVYGKTDADYVAKILSRDESLIQKIAKDFNVKPEIVPEGMSEINPQKELFFNSLIIEREDETKKISKGSSEN